MRATYRTAPVISLLASALAAAAYAFDPFQHGLWLVAYLFLVGFAAQALLRRGQRELGEKASDDAEARICSQSMLWNLGVVLVPAGVMLDARLPVVVGGVALLVSLASFARSAAASRRGTGDFPIWLLRTQLALIAFMAISVLVGTSLAWDEPWV